MCAAHFLLTSSFFDIICWRICSISCFSRIIVVQLCQLSVIRCCRKLKSVKICSTHLRVVCFSRVSSETYYIKIDFRSFKDSNKRHASMSVLENKCAFRKPTTNITANCGYSNMYIRSILVSWWNGCKPFLSLSILIRSMIAFHFHHIWWTSVRMRMKIWKSVNVNE